jgi:hypothetical protein
LFAAWLGVLAACSVDERCDPDQELRKHICFPKERHDASTGGATDAAADRAPISCTTPGAGFGEPCSDGSDCPCGLDFCPKLPGKPTGRCTKRDCLTTPNVCPADWPCMDLSAYEPGLSMCTNPSAFQ